MSLQPEIVCFSGYGDAPMLFYNQDGTPAAQPDSAPVECGSGCDGVVRLTTGKIAVIGGNSPNFGTTGVGVFNRDWTVLGELADGPNGRPSRSAARDDNGYFYGLGTSGGRTRIYKYNADGFVASFDTGTSSGRSPKAIAVNGEGTIAYYVVGSGSATDTVYAWDLVGDANLGAFKTRTGYQVRSDNALAALTSGDVIIGWRLIGGDGILERYNAAGALQQTYVMSGTNAFPIQVARSLTDATFWASYYDDDLTTFSGAQIVQYNTATAELLQQLAPEDGEFEFDGPFTVEPGSEAGYRVSIDGVDRDPLLATFNISAPLNGIASMRADFDSAGSPIFSPDLDAEIVMREYGDNIFGGYITALRTRAFDAPDGLSVVVETTSADYKVAAKRRVVNEIISDPGSPGLVLKDILLRLDDYLTDYGITLDPAQVDGPAVDPVVYEDRELKSIFDELSVLTGYPWDVDVDRVFSMYAIGDRVAPFDLDETDLPAKYFDDITVEPTRNQYANRIYLRFGPNGNAQTTDSFFADGTTAVFTLSAPLTNYAAGVYVGLGYVTAQATASPPVNETLSLTGEGGDWEYNPATNQITRTLGNPSPGDVIQVTYVGKFPVTVTVEDAGEIATHGLFELIVPASDTFSLTVATALAAAELAKHLSVFRRITYSTRERGLTPGMTQNFSIPSRDLDTTGVIVEVVTESEPGGDVLVRRVTALEGTIVQGDWRDLYRQWLGA